MTTLLFLRGTGQLHNMNTYSYEPRQCKQPRLRTKSVQIDETSSIFANRMHQMTSSEPPAQEALLQKKTAARQKNGAFFAPFFILIN